ncbi:MAG: DUF4296 domain-containing protein [Porphyromonadaceae bacterium]|nr:DUF4296 domain-containing protein [Porphyromonadaceae bacterium]
MTRPSRHASSLALGCGLALSLSLLSSCGSKPWKRLGVKTMQELLPEMVIAEQNFAERSLPDSLRLVGYAAILGRHDATLADWDSSLVWYSQHDLESYKDIYDAAHKELEQRRQLLQARSDSLSTLQAKLWQWQAGNVDSVNLLRDSVSFHAGKAYLERSFSYTPDQSYAAGTELAFVLRLSGQPAQTKRALRMELSLCCTDSTVVRKTLELKAPGKLYRISLRVPEGKQMRSSFGRVVGYVPQLPKRGFWAIDSFSFARYTAAALTAPPPSLNGGADTLRDAPALGNEVPPPPTTADTESSF